MSEEIQDQQYADAVAGIPAEPQDDAEDQTTLDAETTPDTQPDDEPKLPEDQELAFKKRLERERAKLEESLRGEIEAKVQQEYLQRIQGTQQQQPDYQVLQQQLMQRIQQDPVGTFYQIAQVAAQQTAAPLIERSRQMERSQRVADLALKYGTELEQLAPMMKEVLDKHPHFWDTEDGLEMAYRWAKVEAGGQIAQEAVSRERQQQQQLNEAKSQARATGGQAQSTESMTSEELATAYAEQLLRIR